MEDQLYLIGEFASMNKVSTRMLRHYDKINLLKPVAIRENGYRYYSEKQIAVISQIIMLRSCEFSLEEIAQILKQNSTAFLMEQAENKIVELNKQENLHKKAITLLESFSQEGLPNHFENQYGISLIQSAESMLCVSRKDFSLEQTDHELYQLFAFLDKKNVSINGCALLLSYFDEQEENRNRVGVPVREFYPDEQYRTIKLPSCKRITAVHYGDYYNIGYAYSSLMKYAEWNGYLVESCFMERYFIDSSQTANPAQYVTEVSVALKNNP